MTPELGEVEGIDNSPKQPFYNEYGQIADPDIAFELALLEENVGLDDARKREGYLFQMHGRELSENQKQHIEMMDELLEKYPHACKGGLLDSGEKYVVFDNPWLYSTEDLYYDWLTKAGRDNKRKQVDVFSQQLDRLIITEQEIISVEREKYAERPIKDRFSLLKPLEGSRTNHLGSLFEADSHLVSAIVTRVRNYHKHLKRFSNADIMRVTVLDGKVVLPCLRIPNFFSSGHTDPVALEAFFNELAFREHVFKDYEKWYNEKYAIEDDFMDLPDCFKKSEYSWVSQKQLEGIKDNSFQSYIDYLTRTKGRAVANRAISEYIEASKKNMTVTELFNVEKMRQLHETCPYACRQLLLDNGQEVIVSDSVYFQAEFIDNPFIKGVLGEDKPDVPDCTSYIFTKDGLYSVFTWTEKEGLVSIPLIDAYVKPLLDSVGHNEEGELDLGGGKKVSISYDGYKMPQDYTKEELRMLSREMKRRNAVLAKLYKKKEEMIQNGEQLPEILELL